MSTDRSNTQGFAVIQVVQAVGWRRVCEAHQRPARRWWASQTRRHPTLKKDEVLKQQAGSLCYVWKPTFGVLPPQEPATPTTPDSAGRAGKRHSRDPV